MQKIKIETNLSLYPMPMVLAGTVVGGRPNFMAVGWVSRVNYKPPMIAIALGKGHYTNEGVHAQKSFSVNIPGIDLIEKVDYCGLTSGKKVDKSALFTVFHGELRDVPMIQECPLCMECALVQTIALPSNELFIGEIVGAYSEEKYLTEGNPDIEKINAFTLTMPDNSYWSVGKKAGAAFNIGKKLIQ